jgi:hypothetical protein
MNTNQLDLLPPELVADLLRKRRFWKKPMNMSLFFGIIVAIISISCTINGMIHAFSSLEKSLGADPSKLAGDISSAMQITLYSIPLAGLGFIICITAFIRLLSLPKPPKQ